MFYMPRSVWYSLEYSFCQTDTFPEHDIAVRDAHGICGVLAANWLDGRLAGNSFVFSVQSIQEKARNVAAANNLRELYSAAMPSRAVGLPTTYDIGQPEQNRQVATIIASRLLTESLILNLDGRYQHALAMCLVGGKRYMFDANFGSYQCSYDKGVSTWFVNNLSTVRPGGSGSYNGWVKYVQVLPVVG